jgi:hypothetical protein
MLTAIRSRGSTTRPTTWISGGTIDTHPRATSKALEFAGLPDLIDDFQNEVNEIYERRTD